MGDFEFRTGATYTAAEIAEDKLSPELEGNTPRRQPDLIYTVSGRYTLDNASFGINLLGATESYAQDSNDLTFDGYNQVNLLANYNLSENLSVSLNINNAFNAEGITEAEEGAGSAADIIRARTLTGRTSSLSVKYTF